MPRKKILFDDPDAHYIGNIWGWKNSFISLGILLFFGTIFLYRLYTVEPIPPSETPNTETPLQDSLSAKKDSLNLNK